MTGVLALLLVLAIALLVAFWLRDRAARRRPEGWHPTQVPDAIPPRQLNEFLAVRFAGTPADGAPAPPDRAPHRAVVWVDRGDEVIVHLDSVRTAVVEGAVLVSIDLETDESGRRPVVVAFSAGDGPEGGLALVTEARPRGPEILVRRWGEAVQEAAYAALLDLAERHAAERNGVPRAMFVRDGALRFAPRTGA